MIGAGRPPEATATAWIGLGANLGDARGAIDAALKALAGLSSTRALRCSPLYRSAPVASSGPDYVNAVAAIETSLAPRALLARLQAIERAHGRERPYRNAPRTLDLDLLLYGDQVIDTTQLIVPHPRMHERAFVLRPLADLDANLVVPGHGRIGDLLASVADQDAQRMDV